MSSGQEGARFLTALFILVPFPFHYLLSTIIFLAAPLGGFWGAFNNDNCYSAVMFGVFFFLEKTLSGCVAWHGKMQGKWQLMEESVQKAPMLMFHCGNECRMEKCCCVAVIMYDGLSAKLEEITEIAALKRNILWFSVISILLCQACNFGLQ